MNWLSVEKVKFLRSNNPNIKPICCCLSLDLVGRSMYQSMSSCRSTAGLRGSVWLGIADCRRV
jgi:hypothetical protein